MDIFMTGYILCLMLSLNCPFYITPLTLSNVYVTLVYVVQILGYLVLIHIWHFVLHFNFIFFSSYERVLDLHLHRHSVSITIDLYYLWFSPTAVYSIKLYTVKYTGYSRCTSFFHQYNRPPRYNRNIIKSSVKHAQS